MTFAELHRSLNGAAIEAVIDGCGESAEIGLYKVHADPFDEPEILDWPDDWPERVTTKFLRELGINVITA